MTTTHYRSLLWLLLLSPTLAMAQPGEVAADTTAVRLFDDWQPAPSQRPETEQSRKMWVGIGYTDQLDTYLGQEKFTGTEVRYGVEQLTHRLGKRTFSEVTHHALFSTGGTRGNSQCLLTALYNLQAGRYYTLDLHQPGLTLAVGALADGTLGVAYNTRNSNNPAQARLSLAVDPAVRATWRFTMAHKPMALHYSAAMPLIGLAFSPNYGQSYYEIFSKGNYDHNCVVTSPFTGPQFHQRLTLDFPLGKARMSVGYLGDIRQMQANSLKYHQYTHAFIVGWRY